VFLFDASQGALYSAKEQIDLFEEVSSIKRTLPALNKIDWVDEGLREEIASYLKGKGMRFLEISAEKGIGVEELKGEALKELFQQNVGEEKA